MRLSIVVEAAALIAMACSPALAAPTEPQIRAGTVLTPNIDVTKAPNFPTVQVTLNNGTVGIQSIMVGLESPSGNHSLFSQPVNLPSYPPPPLNQKLDIAIIPTFGSQAFGPYTEPGTWTVQFITMRSGDGSLINYGTPQIAQIFGGKATIEVTNPASPDIKAPEVGNATILTPVVSLSSSSPYAAIRIPAADAGSGIYSASVSLSGPGAPFNSLSVYAMKTAPAPSGNLIAYQMLPAATATGIYTVTNAYICDYASNCVSLTTPAEIAAHFAKTTISVAK